MRLSWIIVLLITAFAIAFIFVDRCPRCRRCHGFKPTGKSRIRHGSEEIEYQCDGCAHTDWIEANRESGGGGAGGC